MARMMGFKANDEEETEISEYCKAHHFKNTPDFIRVAVFAYIRKNKPGSHRRQPKTGTDPSSVVPSCALET